MKKQLFQYVVILHTYTETDGKKVYNNSEVIIPINTMLASSQTEVVFKATREIATEHATNPDNVEIIVRPF